MQRVRSQGARVVRRDHSCLAATRRRYVATAGCGWQTRCLDTVWGEPIAGLLCRRLNYGSPWSRLVKFCPYSTSASPRAGRTYLDYGM